MEHLAALTAHVRTELSKVIIGQREAVDQLLLTLVCGGHAIIEGVPGLAKTLAVKSLGRICGLGFQRIQCTADLMPADITGTNVFNLATNTFSLHRGPVFTDLLLVDEINRTSPRTQAALLEAMEERQVTIDGVRCPLNENFTVLATQNPIEFQGTYPLPEAQLDRFLLKIGVRYPEEAAEVRILERYAEGFDASDPSTHGIGRVLTREALAGLRAASRRVRVDPALREYMVKLVRRTRAEPTLALGASPRAAVALFQASQALALSEGRDYVVPDDVKSLAPAVLRHRVTLTADAEVEGATADARVDAILRAVEAPR